MNNPKSEEIKATLQADDVHRSWEESYRIDENERFYNQAFDYLIRALALPKGSTILDVGCGPCFHSVRLARRGYNVQAVDFSDSVITMGSTNIKALGLEEQITLQQENILSMSFEDQAFQYVLCWGVLMHIPDIEKAVDELSRIVKPGGLLIISEINMHSIESLLMRGIKSVLRSKQAKVLRTASGTEYWTRSPAGELLTRQADIHWLSQAFAGRGLRVKKRIAGQFSELYTRFKGSMFKGMIHGFNHLWFKYVGAPRPAFGNILILEKLHD